MPNRCKDCKERKRAAKRAKKLRKKARKSQDKMDRAMFIQFLPTLFAQLPAPISVVYVIMSADADGPDYMFLAVLGVWAVSVTMYMLTMKERLKNR